VTVPSAGRRRPPGRYDDPPLLGQRILAVLLAVLAVALVVALGSFLWSRFAGEQVRGQLRSYDVRSATEVSVELEAAKTAGAPAYCVLVATGADGREVGRDIAVLDALGSEEQVVRGQVVLPTSARAIAVELVGCTPERITRESPAP
jgi:hypothetical protein